VRENGVPVGEVTVQSVPVGMDVVFVIDGNETILSTDVNEQTRLQTVQESITRFAQRFMSPRDQVSIIVPDDSGEHGRLLLDASSNPDEVMTAVSTYTPQSPVTTPLNGMMLSALVQTRRMQTDNRFQAILLFSDAGQLHQQLNDDQLLPEAQAQQVAVFNAVLGSDITLTEIDNVSRLAEPTRGNYVHMPTAEDTDPFFLIWQRQANQTQITYRSLLTQNGRYPLTINIGQLNAATEIALDLQPPQVALHVEQDVVRRVGTAVDTLLSDLVPAAVPLSATLTWPDGIARELDEVMLLVNDQPQFLSEQPQLDGTDTLTLLWDVQNSDTGPYELMVQVTDEFGLAGTSPVQLVTIVVERPSPPTPTPIPIAVPTATPASLLETIPRDNLLLGGMALAIALIILLFLLWLRRNRTMLAPPTPTLRPKTPALRAAEVAVHAPESTEPEPLGPHTALFELLDNGLLPEAELFLTEESMTIGRDEAAAQLTLDDKTVSPLHARVRFRNGRYWLYDEGSASGTFLNHERLGLTPRQLQDGDLIKIGRLNFHFRIKPDA
ncbi:MAG: FHA domain-containing protein, partial [Anaerolineales bacterium]|nr:FHA domain-containing protein [Anaerolineales bacterium]